MLGGRIFQTKKKSIYTIQIFNTILKPQLEMLEQFHTSKNIVIYDIQAGSKA